MYCERCGFVLQPTWSFCPKCAHPIELGSEPITEEVVERVFSETPIPGSFAPYDSYDPASYGSGVRTQVLDVIVRQAMAGAPWREICQGPMQVNKISPQDVEDEVRRRRSGGDDPPLSAPVPKKPKKPDGSRREALAMPLASESLVALRVVFKKLLNDCDSDRQRRALSDVLRELDATIEQMRTFEAKAEKPD